VGALRAEPTNLVPMGPEICDGLPTVTAGLKVVAHWSEGRRPGCHGEQSDERTDRHMRGQPGGRGRSPHYVQVVPEQGGMQGEPEQGGLVNLRVTSICLETIALGPQGLAPAGPTSAETRTVSGYVNPP
jgi:hypothetical protein